MKVRRILWGLGGILVFFSISFALPALVALGYDSNDPADVPVRALGIPFTDVQWIVPQTALVFLIVGTLTASAGLICQYFGVEEENLRNREAYAIVALGWLSIAAFGALPYIAMGATGGITDAFFESMSGFTTTGATIFSTVETLPPSLLFWRSFTQWIGGGGIIVLSIAVLASLTQGGSQLLAAETSGLGGERIRPRVAQTAKTLWGVYFALTMLVAAGLTVAIHFTGRMLPLKRAVFDGLAHSFTALATGGFSTYDTSTAFFDSLAVDIVAIAGMVLGGLSFPLLYRSVVSRDPWPLLRDAETRFFLGSAAAVSIFVAVVLWRSGVGIGESLRAAAVQAVSVITTTGFTPYNFDTWPDAARLVLLFMFFTGASTGSTSGAMKAVRILVLFKLVIREMRRLLHPRAVIPLRLGNKVLSDDTIKSVTVFFFTYITLVIGGTIVLTLVGVEMVAAFAAAATCIGNVGPGLGTTFANMTDVPIVGKYTLIFLMWAGRLEIFTVLILFSRESWRR